VPDEEAEELALIYQAKGLPEDEAKTLAKRLIVDKPSALDTMAREELGIDPEELGGSAATAAGASFCLFALGAIIPVAPFFFLSGLVGVIVSVCCATAALFGIGAGITVNIGTRRLVDEVRSGSSYISNSDRRVHFGLGTAERVDSVQVRWPSGLVEQFNNVTVDSIHSLTEGSGVAMNHATPKNSAPSISR